MTFRITTAWVSQTGENPWLLDAYDEFSEDAWNGTPEHFDKAVEGAVKDGGEVRIVDLLIDYEVVEERFRAVETTAKAEPC